MYRSTDSNVFWSLTSALMTSTFPTMFGQTSPMPYPLPAGLPCEHRRSRMAVSNDLRLIVDNSTLELAVATRRLSSLLIKIRRLLMAGSSATIRTFRLADLFATKTLPQARSVAESWTAWNRLLKFTVNLRFTGLSDPVRVVMPVEKPLAASADNHIT